MRTTMGRGGTLGRRNRSIDSMISRRGGSISRKTMMTKEPQIPVDW